MMASYRKHQPYNIDAGLPTTENVIQMYASVLSIPGIQMFHVYHWIFFKFWKLIYSGMLYKQEQAQDFNFCAFTSAENSVLISPMSLIPDKNVIWAQIIQIRQQHVQDMFTYATCLEACK